MSLYIYPDIRIIKMHIFAPFFVYKNGGHFVSDNEAMTSSFGRDLHM